MNIIHFIETYSTAIIIIFIVFNLPFIIPMAIRFWRFIRHLKLVSGK